MIQERFLKDVPLLRSILLKGYLKTGSFRFRQWCNIEG
jgi:hypothetical protein